MRKKQIINMAIPGILGIIAGGATMGFVKVVTKAEVNKKTEDLQRDMRELRKAVENTDSELRKSKLYNDELDKATIRNMKPEDLARIIKERDEAIIVKATEKAEEYAIGKITEYSNYMMDQIDEAYTRLEKAEEYIQVVAENVLGDKASKVIDEVFGSDEDEEDVVSKVSEIVKGEELEQEIEGVVNQEVSKKRGRRKKSEE